VATRTTRTAAASNGLRLIGYLTPSFGRQVKPLHEQTLPAAR
jgi:hypothetical protein